MIYILPVFSRSEATFSRFPLQIYLDYEYDRLWKSSKSDLAVSHFCAAFLTQQLLAALFSFLFTYILFFSPDLITFYSGFCFISDF